MKPNWALIAMTASFTLLLSLNTHSYAWHENLGIDANKAAELYQTKPNDPAIVQWKNSLQSAINDMDECFGIILAITCESTYETITSNCNSHPNTLLACNDSRLAQFPLILQKAEEAQKKIEEKRLEALETEYSSKFPEFGASEVFDRCIKNSTNASSSCVDDVHSLQKQCEFLSSAYDYCKDERFVGYLKQHNSTVSSYSNLTGNSSSSNSTYP